MSDIRHDRVHDTHVIIAPERLHRPHCYGFVDKKEVVKEEHCRIPPACRQPVNVINSGPIAGAIAGAHIARLAGYPNVITLDMGGTSADVCLVRDYRAELRPALLLEGLVAGGEVQVWAEGQRPEGIETRTRQQLEPVGERRQALF